MDELTQLAFDLADSTARSDIEAYASCSLRAGQTWCDVSEVAPDDTEYVADALRYLELRGDALPYRVERDGALIRFGDK